VAIGALPEAVHDGTADQQGQAAGSTAANAGGEQIEKRPSTHGVAAIMETFQGFLDIAAEGSEEAQMALWLEDMLVLRQLLRCLRGLQDSLDQLLPRLPGAPVVGTWA
jgi:hypothetical protein